MTRFFKTTFIAGLAATYVAGAASAADFTDLYTAGHADIAVGYDATDGLYLYYELASSARINGSLLGGSGASADPATVSTVVPESVLTTGNAGLPAPFAGNPLYVLGQTSAGSTTRPYVGWGAEDIDVGLFVGDALTLSLTGVSNSTGGQFVLWGNGFASSPAMNTADGLSLDDSIELTATGHDHYNFGFTAAGVYDLTFTVTGTLVGGGVVTTSDVFRFVVGNIPPPPGPAVPEPSALAMAGLAVAAGGLFAGRRGRASRTTA
ncbi:choice-of-anchor M domain-containing protein [Paludisphaera soli]|uniref:choice-of-anchor M domain-containing protein n=1 Tax=Paludisphaera soli TaxID=2712865 RepID=UPI0013EDE5B0|nr:choice-of-anchor M domain-containing protein [Paludisphaera soli]